jgi:Kef-type K+ transport system membrane component KefB
VSRSGGPRASGLGPRAGVIALVVTIFVAIAAADSGSGSGSDIGSAGSAIGSAGSAIGSAGSGSGSAIVSAESGSGSAIGSASPEARGPRPEAPSAGPTPDAQPTATPQAEPKKPAEEKHTTKENTLFAIKVITGLVVLMVLAYLGGNRRVVKFQEAIGISGVITAGFPFIALGVIASQPSIGILTGEVLSKLRPILHFGLGWLGFIIGAQLDIRVLDRVPKGTAYLVLVEALGPFGIAAAGCGAVMLAFGLSLDNMALWRDMILLGTCAAMTAPRKFRGFANRTWHEGRGADVLLGQLDELVSIVGLLFITSYFRDATSESWSLPDTAWIFVSLGLGVAAGVLIFATIRVPTSDPEFLATLLGGIAFASGLAGYLHLSPIVICFVAGVLVTNFPNDHREEVFRILRHLERSVHLLFLIIVGAVWDVADWRGWVLVPLFVAGRALGKWLGVIASKTAVGALLPSGFADDRTLITPMSGLAVALVISIDNLHEDKGLPWIVTAVIGGSILTEFLVNKRPGEAPLEQLEEPEPSAPIDELDDLGSGGTDTDGPIYRDEVIAPPPKKEPPK